MAILGIDGFVILPHISRHPLNMGHMLQMTGFKLEIFLKLIKEFVAGGVLNPSGLDRGKIGFGKTGERCHLIQR